jgi:imidazolonepropionase-like amidohydrolase
VIKRRDQMRHLDIGRIGRIALLLGVSAALLCFGANPGQRAQSDRAKQPPKTPSTILLKPAGVFDAEDGQVHEGWVVLVKGERIAAVGPAQQVAVPAGAEKIELSGMTLLPGLMDIHSHIFLHPYNETLWNDQVLKEPLAYRTIEAVLHCRDTLMAGFTLLRDLGTEGAGYGDVSVQRAVREGLVPGPRLLVATRAIVATYCYGPGPAGFVPELALPRGAQEASGTTEIMKAVREQVANGADWVKVYADYRHGIGGSVPTFSEDELRTLVAEAHSAGRPVSAHATTAEGMRRAAVAGVETIEHGYGGTEDVFRPSRPRRRTRSILRGTNRGSRPRPGCSRR